MNSAKRLIPALALLTFFRVWAADNFQKLCNETQQVFQDSNQLVIVWWMPTEFWRAAIKDVPQLPGSEKEKIEGILDRYVVFSVIAADIGPIGGINPRPRKQVVENSELKVGGKVIPKLDPSEISGDAQNFFGAMKPMLANMLGQFGQSMEFLFYSSNIDGERLINPSEAGAFSYSVFGKRFDWRLPLGSLLPPKIDPETSEEFPGDFIYNPYTGKKLTEKKRHPDS